MAIKIGNIRTFKPDGSIAIKVDRTSPLGNPYRMSSEIYRDAVCIKYDFMIYTKIKDKQDISFIHELNRIVELARTNDITLLCWCYPRRCHAETIKRYIEHRLEKENSK